MTVYPESHSVHHVGYCWFLGTTLICCLVPIYSKTEVSSQSVVLHCWYPVSENALIPLHCTSATELHSKTFIPARKIWRDITAKLDLLPSSCKKMKTCKCFKMTVFPEVNLLHILFTKRNLPFLKHSLLETLDQGQWPQVILNIGIAPENNLQKTATNKIAPSSYETKKPEYMSDVRNHKNARYARFWKHSALKSLGQGQ